MFGHTAGLGELNNSVVLCFFKYDAQTVSSQGAEEGVKIRTKNEKRIILYIFKFARRLAVCTIRSSRDDKLWFKSTSITNLNPERSSLSLVSEGLSNPSRSVCVQLTVRFIFPTQSALHANGPGHAAAFLQDSN